MPQVDYDALAAKHGGLQDPVIPGNVDLRAQPKVKNPDGTISTVDSSSYGIDGKEYLLPSVTPDGRHLKTDDEIVAEFTKTGRHLGAFADVLSANSYAKRLHEDYAAGVYDTDYDALAAQHGAVGDETPVFRSTNEKDAEGNAVVRGVSDAWSWLNHPVLGDTVKRATDAVANVIDSPSLERSPMSARARGFVAGASQGVGGLVDSLTSPLGIALSLTGLSGESVVIKAIPGAAKLLVLPEVQALKRAVQGLAGAGYTAEGAHRVVTGDTLGDKAQGVAEMAGGATGALTAARPALARPSAGRASRLNLTPEEQAANAFATERGIPLDAATATGNRFVKGVQKVTGESLLGSVPAERAQRAQQTALQRVGTELADETGTRSPQTQEDAGVATRTATETLVQKLSKQSNEAYQRLREIEAKPESSMGGIALPVDLKATKNSLRGLYDRWKRESEIVPLSMSGEKGRAFAALDRLMNGPDVESASVVDQALSSLKSLARGAIMPELRTAGQGGAAFAVGQLDGAVRSAVARAGPEALAALEEGRGAHKTMRGLEPLMEQLQKEPVQVYRKLTAPGDTQIGLLRQVSDVAPSGVADIARAWLDERLNLATERGRFEHADKLYADWRKLGTETKKTLFPSDSHRASLEHFFQLAKRIAENPNPSGTAPTLMKGGELVGLATHPLVTLPPSLVMGGVSKMLYSPRGAAALARYLQRSSPVKAGGVVSAATKRAALVELLASAKSAGVPMGTPVMADDQTVGSK